MFTKITLEKLIPSEELHQDLKSFSKRQRKALYMYLTYLTYSYPDDKLRKATLIARDRLLTMTKSDKNRIEEDGRKNKFSDLLPNIMKHENTP